MESGVLRQTVMSLDYFSAFILILILLSSVFEKDKPILLKIYMGMALTCSLSLLLEAISITASLANLQETGTVRMALSNIAVIGGYGLSFFYACYVANLVGTQRSVCRTVLRVLKILGLAATAAFIAGSSFGLFFRVNNGSTTPGAFFVYTFAYDILACLAGIILIAVYAKRFNTRDVVALLTLPIFIFLSAFVQYLLLNMMYGLFFMAATSLFIIYLMIQMDRNQQRVEQEKRLMDMNVAMMQSQMQPHFLFNALSSIRRMIKKDPEVAEVAIENFSLYLRQNMESMNRVEPIPFDTELKHVEQYLYLEKLRFGERLSIHYDIGFSDFALPVLSLQPIVENAVKHGVLKKEEGGSVWIKTCREGGKVVLTVEDDGVGFRPELMGKDGRMHIGFENVKKRLKMQCKGNVTVDSTVGLGTKVTMTIPLI